MRVWDVHPGYLARSSLLGEHAEIHALCSVIRGGKKGYSLHPETLRWIGRLDRLKKRHDLTVKEMALRGYRHNSPFDHGVGCDRSGSLCYVDHPAEQFALLRKKYSRNALSGRIPLPVFWSDFWTHHRFSLMARGPAQEREIEALTGTGEDRLIGEERSRIESVLELLEKPLDRGALLNVADHLWRYLEEEASAVEKERCRCYLSGGRLPDLFKYFYVLARKYNQTQLLYSTVLADPVDTTRRDGKPHLSSD
jgi:hypothetical protein